MDALPWVALVAAVAVLLSVDWRFFARGREPDVREAIWWSVGWTALGLAVALTPSPRPSRSPAIRC